MKILLTGGTGFIGSHVLHELTKTQHDVVAIRRPGSSPKFAISPEPTWLEMPLDDLRAEHLAEFDVLLHLASTGVSPQNASWRDLAYWNITVPSYLLEEANLAGVSRVVFAGTAAEYGKSADQYEFIPIDAPLQPTSLYAASKAACCLMATTYAIEKHMQVAWLRVFAAYGEGQFKSNFFPSLRAAALAGQDFQMTHGEQVRDYVPVEVVARKLIAACDEVDIYAGIPYIENVGTGIPVTMLEFAQKWWSIWNAKGQILPGTLPYRPNESMRFVPQLLFP